jgi:hypothetical protein
VRFEVLGPLQVIAGDRDEPSTISAARLRVLLAVLLWRANHAVPSDELAELVWDGEPPIGAPEATRVLVMRLRRQLDKRAAARIVTRPAGYAVEISGEELDASRFEALTREAGVSVRAGRWAQAARTAAQALELWRGIPLADISSQPPCTNHSQEWNEFNWVEGGVVVGEGFANVHSGYYLTADVGTGGVEQVAPSSVNETNYYESAWYVTSIPAS